jgi:hypothetical protein
MRPNNEHYHDSCFGGIDGSIDNVVGCGLGQRRAANPDVL